MAYGMNRDLKEGLVKLAIGELGVRHLRPWFSAANVERNNDDPRVIDWNRIHLERDSDQPQVQEFCEKQRNGLAEYVVLLRSCPSPWAKDSEPSNRTSLRRRPPPNSAQRQQSSD